ncbi:MAG: hypothetical protein ACI86M_003351 [Saprospiraceae bacterium]|jgi:hypothetical protein
MNRAITFLLLCFTNILCAQYCGPITAGHEFVHDNLQFNILNGELSMNELNSKVGIGPDGDMDTREYAPLIKSTQIWAGGVDPNGSLKLAVTNAGDQDWVMGPLDEDGQTNPTTCEAWDRVFSVTKEEIIAARKVFDEGGSCEDISESILNWPGKGSPNLELPSGYRGAEFYDENNDNFYDPCDGDFPMVSIPTHYYYGYSEYIFAMPSQISYYVMNDNGGPHLASNSTGIQIQMGVYIFSFKMQDIEDVIYVKYEIDNRATDDIRDFYVGNWIDFEVGCPDNDYVGTDSIRNMVYAYNSDQEDVCPSNTDVQSSSQVGMYYQGIGFDPYKIEIIDGEVVLVHPQNGWEADTLVLRTMSTSLVPVNCESYDNCDFDHEVEYYNSLRGLAKDGSDILDMDGDITKMMFTGDPSNPDSWSLCNEDSKPETTSISSMGPFLLQPGAKTEMLQVFMHATEVGDGSGCSSNIFLQHKQKMVERFYHWGFYHQVGPPPPVVDVDKTNLGFRLSISEVPFDYSEKVQNGEKFFPPRYNFEGIKIYQVKSENFDLMELENTDLSRLLYQGDVENEISDIFNIEPMFSGDVKTYVPNRKVEGANIGITQVVTFNTDLFTNLAVESGKEYYFVAVSYAYNNYEEFDVIAETGQQYPYIQSTCGIKVINSQTILSNTEIPIIGNYTFESFGQEWEINNVKSDLQISLLSASGQLIVKRNLKNDDLFSSQMVNDLPNGVYFIRVLEENTQSIKVHRIFAIN